jgi:hypothetical protein
MCPESCHDKLYNSYNPKGFGCHPNDIAAMRWFFKHVFATQKMPVGMCSEKYNLHLSAFRDDKKVLLEEQLTGDFWKGFGAYFAERVGLGKYAAQISRSLGEIYTARHPELEQVQPESKLETAVNTSSVQSEDRADDAYPYLPLGIALLMNR